MRLTPLDIRKQEFRKGMRGLDADEVYAFLNTVADEYEAVLNDNKALRERLLELDDKVQEYRNMEKTLRDTLLTAERITVEAKDNARREADLIVKQAELEADRGVRNIKDAGMRLRQEIQILKRQRDSYLSQMKVLVESHLRFLEGAEKDFNEEQDKIEAEHNEWSAQNKTRAREDIESTSATASVEPAERVAKTAPEPPRSPSASSPLEGSDDNPRTETRASALETESLAATSTATGSEVPLGEVGELISKVAAAREEARAPRETADSDTPLPQGTAQSEAATDDRDAETDSDIPDDSLASSDDWSLEKLKQDILARRAGSDEDD